MKYIITCREVDNVPAESMNDYHLYLVFLQNGKDVDKSRNHVKQILTFKQNNVEMYHKTKQIDIIKLERSLKD